MVTQEVIDSIMSGKHNDRVVAEEVDDYPEKLQKAAVSRDVPEWVRKAANRILEISMRRSIPVGKVPFEDVGLGLHESLLERAICQPEEERFYKIVMEFEAAIKFLEGR
jgi:hypothetical protein